MPNSTAHQTDIKSKTMCTKPPEWSFLKHIPRVNKHITKGVSFHPKLHDPDKWELVSQSLYLKPFFLNVEMFCKEHISSSLYFKPTIWVLHSFVSLQRTHPFMLKKKVINTQVIKVHKSHSMSSSLFSF